VRATTLNPLAVEDAGARHDVAAVPHPDVGFVWGTAIDDIEAEWRDLEINAANPLPFNGFDFLWHWRAVFCIGKDAAKPFAVTVRENGRLVALLPMMISRSGALRVCQWMGEPLTEYGDAIVRRGYTRPGWLEHAVERLKACPDADIFYLRKVREDALIAPVLDRMIPALGAPRHAPWIDLSDMAGPVLRGNPALQRKIERAKKEREAKGRMDFCVTHAGPQAAAVTESAVTFRQDWVLKNGAASRACADARCATLMNRMAADERRGRDFVVGELSLNGETIAGEIGLRSGERYYALIGAHNPAFAEHEPELICRNSMVGWCISEGMRSFDLLVPDEAGKRAWMPSQATVRTHAAGRTIGGHLCRAWLACIRPLVKRLLMAMPTSLRARFTREIAGVTR